MPYPPKIRNRALQQCIEVLDSIGGRAVMAPVHSLTRSFYLKLFTPTLEFALRRALKLDVTLIPRNSVHSKNRFNVLRSDLDYTIILPDRSSDRSVEELRDLYEAIRARVIFVGEVEIYTQSEFDVRQELKHGLEPLLTLIWYLRKWIWQHQALEEAPGAYHRSKAIGSIQQIFFQLTGEKLLPSSRKEKNRKISDSVHRLVLREFAGRPFSTSQLFHLVTHSKFLGWSIQVGAKSTFASDEKWEIVLPPESGMTFLALLPGIELQANLEEKLRELRDFVAIGQALGAVAMEELLLCKSASRSSGTSSKEAEVWCGYLSRLVEKYNPMLARNCFKVL